MIKAGEVIPDDPFPTCSECQSSHTPPDFDVDAFDDKVEARVRQLVEVFEANGLPTDPAMVTAFTELLVRMCIAHNISPRTICRIILAAGGITNTLKVVMDCNERLSDETLAGLLADMTRH